MAEEVRVGPVAASLCYPLFSLMVLLPPPPPPPPPSIRPLCILLAPLIFFWNIYPILTHLTVKDTKVALKIQILAVTIIMFTVMLARLILLLVIRDSQVLAKLVVVTIFFIGWGQTARLQRVRQNTADRILKFDKRYKAFEIAGYFQKHREIIG